MTMLAHMIGIDGLEAARTGQKLILLYGRLEDHDVYPDTIQHYDEWCVALVPNDIDRLVASPINIVDLSDG